MGIPTFIQSNSSDTTDIASISFTSSLDSTYDHYMFVCTDINPATDGTEFGFQCSIDGGSNYNVSMGSIFFDAYHNEADDGAALGYQAANDLQNATTIQFLSRNTGNGADESCAGILHLYRPSSTTYFKHFQGEFHSYGNSNFSLHQFMGGTFYDSDDDINAIQFKMSSGNLDGLVQMYGIA